MEAQPNRKEDAMKTFIRIAVPSVLIAVVVVVLWAWGIEESHLRHLWVHNLSYVLKKEWFVVPLVALIYAAAFFIVRWHLIAWPARLDLNSWIGDLQLNIDLEDVQLNIELESPGDKEKQDKLRLLKEKLRLLREALKGTTERLDPIRISDRLFWSRGQEQAKCSLVSDVECQLAVLQSAARVRARLEAAEQDLREMPAKSAGALADRIHNDLDRASDERIHNDLDRASDERMRSLLYEALNTINSNYEDDYDNTLNWHNKTVWLIGIGILLLILLEGTRRGGGGLFALGAAGGFLSRLMRALKQKDTPTDSGAYWTTLFLSPLEGALAGWTGILLVELAHTLGVLGSVFAGVKITFESGYGELALGLAFLLGFSERLFDAILTPIEDKIAPESSSSSSSSSASPSSRSGPSPPSRSFLSPRPSSSGSSSSSSSSGSI
jgi:hypothetical protein